MKRHDEIIAQNTCHISSIAMDNTINIKIVFHFLAPIGSYNRDRVLSRAHDVTLSLNDDFNNYSTNANTMNNFRYKSIINQVFISNIPKQNVYLGHEYTKFLPTRPSNITFELGEIYYYPVKHKLNLSSYDDLKDVEIESQVIKQFIHQNRADAINPENLLNVWIIDMTETNILGFSNFPWEIVDNYHGIVLNRRCFFPEDYGENYFPSFKTLTHQVGHYFGLLHVFSQNSGTGACASANINADSETTFENMISDDIDSPIQFSNICDPCDKLNNKKLHLDDQYNPLFMNFMDYTYDKYVTMFTANQIQKMRYMILTYRSKINSITNNIKLPVPKYNPDTDTIMGIASCKYTNTTRNPPLIPSHEIVNNPRLAAQGFITQQPQMIPPFACLPENNEFVPNLSINRNNGNEQLLSNIQSNFPADTMCDKKSCDDVLQNYQNYNSDDGYAKHYPYDPYAAQQYQQNMPFWQEYQKQQEQILPNNPMNAFAPNGQSGQQSIQQNIQQCMPQIIPPNIPPCMPPNGYPGVPMDPRTDPRFVSQMSQQMGPQIDPRMNQQIDPRMGQQIDPRMIQQMDPRMIQQMDPRMIPQMNQQIDSRMNQQMDPRMYPQMNQQMVHHQQNNIRRVDPQFQHLQKPAKCNKNDNFADNEINHEAVKNLRAQRFCPKPKQNIPEFTENPVPIMNHVPSHMCAPLQPLQPFQPLQPQKEIDVCVNNTMAPSDLIEKISRVDEQIKNLKTCVPVQNMQPNVPQNTGRQILPKVAHCESTNRFNKYGQLSSPRVGSRIVSGQNCAIVPKKRFIRTKPLNTH